MKRLYDIKRTLFYKNNVDKLDSVKFKPIKYTFQGLAYSYGIDIVCNDSLIAIEPAGGRWFKVTCKGECKHLNSIKEVQRFVSSRILLYWVY